MPHQTLLAGAKVAIHTRDPLSRAALAHWLARDPRFTDIGADSAREADVQVVSVAAADPALLGLLRRLGGRGGGRFLVIVDQHWNVDLTEAIACGVRAVLWRSQFSASAFVQALVAIAGESGPPGGLHSSLLDQIQSRHDVLATGGLISCGMSEREQAVLRLLSEGRELTEISEKLSYSERTVKDTLRGVMERFQFRSHAHAASYAVRAGFI
jgi:DNA-binding NarL/FixJ family response regulator